VPVPVQELFAKQGPLCADLAGTSAKPGLYFQEAGADVTVEAREILTAMAKHLVEDEDNVRIEGHADSNENPEVALQRARAVRDALVGLGVSKSQLRPESCKSLHPLSRTHPAANRRVEVHLT